MSQCLQFEIDPLKISEDVVGSVLVAVDVIAYAREEHPREARSPICLVAAAHTGGLSSISRVYTKLFVAAAPSREEERAILRDFSAYLGMFDGGTLTAHYGAFEENGFDLNYIVTRIREGHPELDRAPAAAAPAAARLRVDPHSDLGLLPLDERVDLADRGGPDLHMHHACLPRR